MRRLGPSPREWEFLNGHAPISAETLWLERVEQSVGDGPGERGLEAALAASRATGLWPDGSLRQRVNQKCLMNPSPTVTKIKYVGLDVHAETIAVAIADSSGAVCPYGIVSTHFHSVDTLVKKLAEGSGKSSCR